MKAPAATLLRTLVAFAVGMASASGARADDICGDGFDAAPPDQRALTGSVALLTPDDAPSIPANTVVITIGGFLDRDLVSKAVAAIEEADRRADKLILRLDSHGGTRSAAVAMTEALDAFKGSGNRLTTLVQQGDVCASACILVFLTGTRRHAGNASVWGFHGACPTGTNVPDPAATAWMLAQMEAGGAKPGFVIDLAEGPYLKEPGVYWLSGYELFAVADAGIVTDLVPAWQPEYPTVRSLPRSPD